MFQLEGNNSSDVLPLSRFRVVDLSRVLAAPFCTMILGDLGADILKVESPEGDLTRHWAPPEIGGETAYYLSTNRNKRSIVIDLKRSEGREVLRRLLVDADILVDNFKFGRLDAWGFSDERIQQDFPRLIHVHVASFGSTSKYKNIPAVDLVAQAMSGLMSVTGFPNNPPTKVGVPITDVIAGLYGAIGAIAGLIERESTSKGVRIEVPLLDAAVSAIVNVAQNFFVTGEIPERLGNNHPTVVPYESFRARDGMFVLAVSSDQQFARLCSEVIMDNAMSNDERFCDNKSRFANKETLHQILEKKFQDKNVSEWVNACWNHGIPAAPIRNLKDVFDDSYAHEQNMVATVPHPTAGDIKVQVDPMYINGKKPPVRYVPPLMGQQTDEILLEAGFHRDEISKLREDQIIK